MFRISTLKTRTALRAWAYLLVLLPCVAIFAESRITVLDNQGSVKPRHLNSHIDYSKCCASIPNAENALSVAFPQDMAITANGATLYVAMFGTSEIGIYKTQELENNSLVPNIANQIPVSGGGPSGLALDERNGRLYVLTRFDNSISIIDTKRRREVDHLPCSTLNLNILLKAGLFSTMLPLVPATEIRLSPVAIFLVISTAPGLGSGRPGRRSDRKQRTVPGRRRHRFFPAARATRKPALPAYERPDDHAKPTRMDNHGSMHWRGDRTGGNTAILNIDAGPNLQPNGGSFNEDIAFLKFNIAFPHLVGRDAFIADADMQKFTIFILEITLSAQP